MPLYNGVPFLARSIDSILCQSRRDFEFIIVDDGSTDGSDRVVHQFCDSRIRYFRKENGGYASALNVALAHARGEFIVNQDADDISAPGRFETMLRQFASPDVGFVHTDMLLIDERDRPAGYWQGRNIEARRLLRFLLKVGTPFNNTTYMARREVLEGFSFDTELRFGEDTDMVAQVLDRWTTVHVPEPLYLYRRHSQNVSLNVPYEKMINGPRKLLSRHTLRELVPELPWGEGEDEALAARARAVVALLLFRRGFAPDAQEWLNRAAETAASRWFIEALYQLMAGRPEECLRLLSGGEQDAVALHYAGEALALLGDAGGAAQRFLAALALNPDYSEPLDGLRALGARADMRTVDTTWSALRPR